MVDFFSFPQCNGCKSKLKFRSKDDSQGKKSPVYMTESLLDVINFESLRDKYCKDCNNKQGVGAVDAGTMLSTDATLIEFKNGVLDRKEIEHLQHQVDGSIEVMKNYLNLSDEVISKEVDFILDFNLEKNDVTKGSISPSDIELTLHIISKGNNNVQLFGMDAYNSVFRNVRTLSKDQFNVMIANF